MKRTYSQAAPGGTSRPRKKAKYTVATAKPTNLSYTHKLLRQKQTAVLRYQEDFNLDAGVAGLPAFYQFSCTALRDPNHTGIGHQPRGFDQLMTLYSHYIVNEVNIEVYYSYNITRDGIGFIQLRDKAATGMTRTDALEYQTMTEGNVARLERGFGGKLQMTCKPNQFLGLKYQDESLKGDTSTNPAADCYFTVGFMPIDPIDCQPMACVVKLTYKVTLLEPTEPAES